MVVVVQPTATCHARPTIIGIRTVPRRGDLLEDYQERPPLVQRNNKCGWLSKLYVVRCKLPFIIDQQRVSRYQRRVTQRN
jgi:hypothetical protein